MDKPFPSEIPLAPHGNHSSGECSDVSGKQLLGAMLEKNIDAVTTLLQEGCPLLTYGGASLIEASRQGFAKGVQCLLKLLVDVHVGNDQPLRRAAEHGYVEVVLLLLDAGADIHAVHDQALRYACAHGYLDVVQLLVEKGADIHAYKNTPILNAVDGGHVPIFLFLLARGALFDVADTQFLNRAILALELPMVKELVHMGADAHEGVIYAKRHLHGESGITRWLEELLAIREEQKVLHREAPSQSSFTHMKRI